MATVTEIIHEIETAYAAYNAAFHDEDVAGVVRYISAPYVTPLAAAPRRLPKLMTKISKGSKAHLPA